MSKIVQRYCLCSFSILVVVFIIYYNFLRSENDSNQLGYSDQFVAVAYVNDDDHDISSMHKNVPNFDWKSENVLVNYTDFRYKITPNVCNGGEQYLLGILLVTSYVGHDEVRSAHRTAITQKMLKELGIFRVFLLAEVPKREKFITQPAVYAEHNQFNDIVQGNFVEAYRNLTYKHIMGLKWSSLHPCLRPKFIIKMDDDIVVDFYYLANYLKSEKFKTYSPITAHYMAGYTLEKVLAIRKKQNKWYVSEDEFSNNIYPAYLSGWMYVMSPATAQALVKLSAKPSTKFFWIDDTWVTGILRHELGIHINESWNSQFSANSQFLDCCITDLEKHNFACPFIAGPNGGDHKLITKFLQTIEKRCYNQKISGTNVCHDRPSDMPPLKKTCVGVDKHLLVENHGAAIVSAIKL